MENELPFPGGQPVMSAAPPLGAPAPLPEDHDPFAQPSRGGGAARRLRSRIGSALAAIAALFAKFFAAIKGVVLLLPKVKLLTTAGTALVSVVLYSLFWGWAFAFGFVVLLFVHEMGHVIQLRREGIKASAPMFLPGFGAVVMMRAMPASASPSRRRRTATCCARSPTWASC